MSKSPTELESEISDARRSLAEDLDALKDKAAPRRMMGEAARRARTKSREVGDRVLHKAKANPAPLAVMGAAIAGAAWLLARRRRSRDAGLVADRRAS
jgi:LPXTG-motif cell wall-anchored protein